jgi:hypothetical protein
MILRIVHRQDSTRQLPEGDTEGQLSQGARRLGDIASEIESGGSLHLRSAISNKQQAQGFSRQRSVVRRPPSAPQHAQDMSSTSR